MNPADKTAPAMPLALALKYAESIKDWLGPCCAQLEIAGSIRRRRAFCNDIDLVCVPNVITSKNGDLFGQPVNVLHDHLGAYVRVERRARWEAGEHSPSGENFILQLPKCQLDIFIATPKTWGAVLLCRTGSKEHNIWLASRAKERGWHWHPQRGLQIYDAKSVSLRTVAAMELEIYQALDLPWIAPENREREFLLQNFRAVGKEARNE